MNALSPIQAVEAKVEALERRLDAQERRMCDQLLPAYLSLLAADYQRLMDICEPFHVSPQLPRHRRLIVRELLLRGWSVPRIARVLGIGEQKVRNHLKMSRRQPQSE